MAFWPLSHIRNIPLARPVLAAALAAVIFIADTVTNLEIAVAVFYVVVVLISMSFCQQRGVVLVSAGCMVLTVLSYFLTPAGAPGPGITNSAISLVAIGATAYLALKIASAERAVHEARSHLAHVTRVTTLGELTASIAHEINQPLAAIAMNSNACLRWLTGQPPNLEEARQAAGRIVNDANRAGEVIKRIRALTKGAPSKIGHVNINESILDVVMLMRNEVEQHQISLRTELAEDLPAIRGDRVQLQQVVLNLLMNAIDAVASMADGRRFVLVTTAKGDGGGIAVSICDSGVGVDQDQLGRLFEPFYTTKPEGMGMGLAISRSIVEAHGGHISAAPGSPQGMVVTFTLPETVKGLS